MSCINSTELASDFCELDNFIRLCKTRRYILQRSRKTQRAVTHRIRDELLHLFELGWRRWSIIKADDVLAHLGRADKRAEIHARTLPLKSFEVFIKRLPIDR